MTVKTSNAGVVLPKKNKGFFRTLGRQYQLMIMSVPVLLYVLLFNYGPLWGWLTAFQDYNVKKGLMGSKWVGWDNFTFLFRDKDFILTIRNTLAMSVINLVFSTVCSILLAVLLNEVRNRRFKRTVQTVTYLPHFLSWVIVVGMAQNIFPVMVQSMNCFYQQDSSKNLCSSWERENTSGGCSVQSMSGRKSDGVPSSILQR